MSISRRVSAVAFWASVGLAQAQFSFTNVADNHYEYDDRLTFTVGALAGYDYLVLLGTNVLPVNVPVTIDQPDYYELRVFATNRATRQVSTTNLQFNVVASARNGSENGLPPWVPYPTIPSASAEFAGAKLRLIAPQAFPAGYPVPVVAWVENDQGHAVRVNGALTAPGHPSIPIKRGVGSGFLATNLPAGLLTYEPAVGGLSAGANINLENNPTWTPVSGMLGPSTVWEENKRVHVTGNLTNPAGGVLTIGAGAIVRLNASNEVWNFGQIIINGTTNRPAVFMPAVTGRHWGGFVQHADNASFTATGAIFTGSGARDCWFKGHECSTGWTNISSHRGQQALISLRGVNCNLTLTDCAAIYLRGQLGHSLGSGSFSYKITLNRFLLQRCITGGEYTGALFKVNDSAFIEFANDLTVGESGQFVDGDNDGLYITTAPTGQHHGMTNTLFGWTKDDGIDSGGDGAGTFHYQNCWFESIFHEGNSLSGSGKDVNHHQGVFLNCGQGLEAGYSGSTSGPAGHLDGCLATGNVVGGRFGDNYDWTYRGSLQANDSILIHNHRDVWGMNFNPTDGWTYRSSAMDIQNNSFTVPNPYHPNNSVWDPATEGGRLAQYLTTPPDAAVGIGIATWESQGSLSDPPDTIPVRLSSFTTQSVSVDYAVQEASGATLASGTLTFTPGQTVQHIPLSIANPQSYSLVRVSLNNPAHCELTGVRNYYLLGNSGSITLIAPGAVWRYLDTGVDQGTAWREPGFNDAGWEFGPAQLGFGESDQATPISDNNQITTYFRRAFTVTDPQAFDRLSLWMLRDDGGVVFLNGSQVYHSTNLPSAPTNIVYSTVTLPDMNGENDIDTATLGTSHLRADTNVVAVEMHQQSATSSDVSFDFELVGILEPRVELAHFGTDLVLYWADPTFALEQAPTVTGPWTPMGVSSPAQIQPTLPQQFFRLSKD